MKFSLMLVTLLASQLSFAQTMSEMKVKKAMLERAELIDQTIIDARADLEDGDISGGCAKVKVLFALYPDHVSAIGQHMNMMKNKIKKTAKQSVKELSYLHQQSQICDSKDHDDVDPEELSEGLRKLGKSLNKQRRLITNKDTDRNNYFEYHYEF